jgi:hypothetical protein
MVITPVDQEGVSSQVLIAVRIAPKVLLEPAIVEVPIQPTVASPPTPVVSKSPEGQDELIPLASPTVLMPSRLLAPSAAKHQPLPTRPAESAPQFTPNTVDSTPRDPVIVHSNSKGTTAKSLANPGRNCKSRIPLPRFPMLGTLDWAPRKRVPLFNPSRHVPEDYRLHPSILVQIDGFCAKIIRSRISWDVFGIEQNTCSRLYGQHPKPWAGFFPLLNGPPGIIAHIVARAILEKCCAVFIVQKPDPSKQQEFALNTDGMHWYQVLKSKQVVSFSIIPTPQHKARKPWEAIVANFNPTSHVKIHTPDFGPVVIQQILTIEIPRWIMPVPFMIPHFRDLLADPPTVIESTSGSCKARRPSLCIANIPQRGPSPIINAQVQRTAASYPNTQLAEFVVDGCASGFGKFNGNHLLAREAPNAISAVTNAAAVAASVAKEVETGRFLGPFPEPPFPNPWCESQARVIPMATIPKDKWDPVSEEIRRLTNLSKGFQHENSVNDLCHDPLYTSNYLNHGQLAATTRWFGTNTLIYAKDVKNAYRILTIKLMLLFLFVCKVTTDGTDSFYVDRCNPFGWRQSQYHWESFAALVWWELRRVGLLYAYYYVDNFFFFIPPLPSGLPDWDEARRVKQKADAVFESFGLPMHDEQQGVRLKALGWMSDSSSMRVRMLPSRVTLSRRLLSEWSVKRSCSIRELQSLIGLFIFITGVVQNGRPELRNLMLLLNRGERRRQQLSLSPEATCVSVDDQTRASLRLWNQDLPLWDSDGIAIPSMFLNEMDLRVWQTDAATSYGGGAIDLRSGLFLSFPWDQLEIIAMICKEAPSAPLCEAWVILQCARLWIPSYPHSEVKIETDSATFALAFHKGYSNNDNIHKVLIELRSLAREHDVILYIIAIPRTNNQVSDSLATGKISIALRLLKADFPELVPSHLQMFTRPTLS